jgi:hypothetical protein
MSPFKFPLLVTFSLLQAAIPSVAQVKDKGASSVPPVQIPLSSEEGERSFQVAPGFKDQGFWSAPQKLVQVL